MDEQPSYTRALGRRLWGVVRLVRPLNVVLFAAGVAVGGLLTAGTDALEGERGMRLLLAALSAALIGGAANSLNDAFDLEVDRINRPGRPLPSQQVTVRTARGLWMGGTMAGLALSLWLSDGHVALALACAALLYAYSAWLKRRVLVGNVVVALVAGAALVYGGWAVGAPGPAFAGAAFAFLATLAREITKDVQDARGDAAAGLRTLPLVYGAAPALSLGTAVLGLTVALTPLPFLVLGYSGLYLLLVLVTDGLLLRSLWLLRLPPLEGQPARAGRVLKGAMGTGLLALAAAGLVS